MSGKGTDNGSGSGASSALLNQPIVMDVGTATTKAGFAGGAKPKVSRSIDVHTTGCLQISSLQEVLASFRTYVR
jgi:hypothetical protein